MGEAKVVSNLEGSHQMCKSFCGRPEKACDWIVTLWSRWWIYAKYSWNSNCMNGTNLDDWYMVNIARIVTVWTIGI